MPFLAACSPYYCSVHCVQSVQSAECRCGVVNDESCHLDPTMRRGTEREREAQRERDREMRVITRFRSPFRRGEVQVGTYC